MIKDENCLTNRHERYAKEKIIKETKIIENLIEQLENNYQSAYSCIPLNTSLDLNKKDIANIKRNLNPVYIEVISLIQEDEQGYDEECRTDCWNANQVLYALYYILSKNIVEKICSDNNIEFHSKATMLKNELIIHDLKEMLK